MPVMWAQTPGVPIMNSYPPEVRQEGTSVKSEVPIGCFVDVLFRACSFAGGLRGVIRSLIIGASSRTARVAPRL